MSIVTFTASIYFADLFPGQRYATGQTRFNLKPDHLLYIILASGRSIDRRPFRFEISNLGTGPEI